MEEKDYDKQAKDFLTKTGTTLYVKYLNHEKYFEDDKEPRDTYISPSKEEKEHILESSDKA
jgi:hypothetical protein